MRVAAWFGVLALGLQAYILVHLANDLVDAVDEVLAVSSAGQLDEQPAQPVVVATDEREHDSHHGGGPHPRHHDCAIFMSSPGASAFVLPGSIEIRRACLSGAPPVASVADAVIRTSCPASYAARAPPVTV